MHRWLNAFLLLVLISNGFILASPPSHVLADPAVSVGIRLWNYNVTHVVSDASVSILNGTTTQASGLTNLTGWVNLTVPNAGNFTLQVKVYNIVAYNNTLNVNATGENFADVRGIDVADYSFIFTDSLSRRVEDVQVDLKVNSSAVATTRSLSNGSAVVRNLPFHAYNITASRQQVSISNSTITVNATTYNQTTALPVPTYDYSLTVKDHNGANTVLSGTVSIYDVGVSTHNATQPLSNPTQFQDLWPGKYWVIVISSSVNIWQSVETIRSNYTQIINARTGYSITLHVLDALGRPVPSVSVALILNSATLESKATDSAGSVTFGNLAATNYILNMTVLGKSYTTPANITDASLDFPLTLGDVFVVAGAPLNTAPLIASFTLVMTIGAAGGTFWLYRHRKASSTTPKKEEKESS